VTKANVAGKAAAQSMIDKSSETFLVCRTLGHKFDEGTSTVKRSGGKFFWSMGCYRCGTVRTKLLSPQGRIIGADYSYPKGYTTPGIGRLDANGLAHLRIHVVMQVLGSVR
jgi:hypothetical protein